jgi:large subunit ribosomal protein L28e
MSESLVWHLIRDNNCFLKKVGNTSRTTEVQFSSEPGNLMNVNTFKYSGVANNKAIGLNAGKTAKGASTIVLTRKNAKSLSKPAKATSSIPLKALKKRSLKALNNLVGTGKYRADLASAAKARFNRLHEATYARGSKSASSRRGKKAAFSFGKKTSFKFGKTVATA